jgi:hypothetical protein
MWNELKYKLLNAEVALATSVWRVKGLLLSKAASARWLRGRAATRGRAMAAARVLIEVYMVIWLWVVMLCN